MSQQVDPRTLPEPLDQALAVLFDGKQNSSNWMSCVEIAKVLRDKYGIALHWRTIQSLLDKSDGFVTRKKLNKRWHYTLLDAGEQHLVAPRGDIVFVDPSKALQNIITLHDLLSKMGGPVSVCDPYLDSVTMEHLDSCSGASRIRLLTHNVRDSGRLRQLITAFPQSGRILEVRVTGRAVLHDRYIFDRGKFYILGSSLNGFGKKQSFIIEAGQDFR